MSRDIQPIADALIGTCKELENVLDELNFGNLTDDEEFELSELVFQCETCGWWYENADKVEFEEVCESCN